MIAGLLHHVMIFPILLPLATGSILLFFDERRHMIKSMISLSSTALLVIVVISLLLHTQDIAPLSDVYFLGNWVAPIGIVLVVDRLSAIMLFLSSILGLSSLVFAMAHWHKAGPHFHSLMQFLFVGINGIFLTGDVFNLFVFFEVMLTASYALLLHGSGVMRVRSGMHYVVINLLASSCFLIGTATIYGVAGTLNMADLAVKITTIDPNDYLLFQTAVSIVGLTFLVKAGMWPLSFWLPSAYSSAAAPVGAVFTILSKVGVYVILRLSLLVFGAKSGELEAFGNNLIFYGGLITIAFGSIGVLASQALARLAANCVLVSSGTALTAIGTGNPILTSIIIYYILTATFALAAFFLLVELIERDQDAVANVLAITIEVYGDDEVEQEDEIGFYIPATLAILGACFGICAVLIIGIPPFSGFLAKFMLISGMFRFEDVEHNSYILPYHIWIYVLFIVLSGLASLVAMVRSGIRAFWTKVDVTVPKVQMIELFPVVFLLSLCFILTLMVKPIMEYLNATAAVLHTPADYVRSISSSFFGFEDWGSR